VLDDAAVVEIDDAVGFAQVLETCGACCVKSSLVFFVSST